MTSDLSAIAGRWFVPNPDRGQSMWLPTTRLITGGTYIIDAAGRVSVKLSTRDRYGRSHAKELSGEVASFDGTSVSLTLGSDIKETFALADRRTMRRVTSNIGTKEPSIDLVLQKRLAKRPARDVNSMLAFIHVPKTGGTSVNAIIASESWDYFNFSPGHSIAEFLTASREERSSFDAAFGHMPFGIDQHIDTKCRYAAFLRDPIDHALSRYYYARQMTNTRQHRVAHEMNVVQFSINPAWWNNDNPQTRRLATYDWAELARSSARWAELPEPCDQARLSQAKANLDRCEFVGIYAEFEKSVRAFCDVFGFSCDRIPKLNVTGNRHSADDLTFDERAALRDHLRFDIELYEYAQHRAKLT